MKAILSVAVYLVLVFALGLVMAFTAKPETVELDRADEDF